MNFFMKDLLFSLNTSMKRQPNMLAKCLSTNNPQS